MKKLNKKNQLYQTNIIFLNKKREYFLSNLKCFNETERRLINPHIYKVDISNELYDLKMKLINKLIEEIEALKESNAKER